MAMDDRRERGPYASGLARREAILDAAVDLLAEVGYHGMSLRDVARRVGISHPGVIYHFPNKEALLMAVVDRYEAEAGFDVSTLAKMDPESVFDSLLHMVSQLVDSPIIIEMECMLAVEASSPLHPAHEHFRERNNNTLRVLEKAWSRMQLEGKAKHDSDPTEMAAAQVALLYGSLTVWLYDRSLHVTNLMATFTMSYFTPDHYQHVIDHYRECGWLA